jgi:hypothetical protein
VLGELFQVGWQLPALWVAFQECPEFIARIAARL